MRPKRLSRRRFLSQAGAGLAGVGMAPAFAPYVFTADAEDRAKPRAKNDRLGIAAVGLRYQGSVITEKALPYGDVVALCDVDRQIAEKAREQFGGKAALYEDYRKLLERPDVDVVLIGTPDHWHVPIAVAACRAGKDVYCEKPVSLTVDEGKLLAKVVRQTGAVVQVGSWQRSDHRFRTACEMIRAGRLGKLRRVGVTLGENPRGGPFATMAPPAHLNWDLWQGQAPAAPYCPQRCHYTFRWWYDYAGGQMTDWGAHHVDIAQWAIGTQSAASPGHAGPSEIDGRGELPDTPGGYTVPTRFSAKLLYPGGVELTVSDTGRNGILFEGERGRMFVNRGTLAGAPVDALKDDPLAREDFKLYAHDNLARPPREGKLQSIINHMGNFFDCVKSRQQPVSDVESQHRSATTCHLVNISIRLKRKLTWDPRREEIVGDAEAGRMLRRQPRAGFEIEG
jgi:myo-inositol 2-dehydrogenase / D-chiro-inositol 1-dehydrogenase